MGPGMPPPRMGDKKIAPKFPRPKTLKEVPKYFLNVAGDFIFHLFYIFKLVWDANPGVLFLMAFMCVYNGIAPVISSLIGATLLNTLAEAYIGSVEFRGVIFILVVQFGYIFFNNVVQNISSILSRIANEVVSNNIKIKIMNKAKEIDTGCFDLPNFYEKFENASREAGNRPISILNATFSIFSTIISMVSYIVILWGVNKYAPLIIIAVAIPNAIINFIYRKKNFLFMRWRSKDRRQMNYYSELLTNKDMVKELRIFGLSDFFIGKYKEVFKRYFTGLKKLIISENIWYIALSLITSTVNCLLYLFIAEKVCNGEFQVGSFSLYTGALGAISGGVFSLISTSASIYEGTLFVDNIIEFMNQKKTIVSCLPEPAKVAHHTGHTIKFDNVSFCYPGTEKQVLKNLNFTVSAGETLVLVGLNGAGKTTLIKLLTRLYDPTDGIIYLDGRNIKDYDVDDLYKIFGIIFQDFGKYAFTVKENIRFGQIEKNENEQDIEEAAKQSNADVFIDKLSDKYNTPLMRYFEENGTELSIGQWQKLAIARAFYSDSDVLILDEPTASLDPMAEQEIFNQFDRLRKDKTTIFVSHRLSSATVATKILVMEYGEIIEEGNHNELMKKRGRYYELFSTQAKRYITNIDGVTQSIAETSEFVPEPVPVLTHAGAELPSDGYRPNGLSQKDFNNAGRLRYEKQNKKTPDNKENE